MPVQCQILSDSTCDFSADQAKRLGVTILPFHYVEAGKPDGGLSGDDDLFCSISARDFYDAIRGGAMPMTSQPSQLEFEDAFAKVEESGVPAVLFTITSGLSGGYDGAVMALKRFREVNGEGVPIYIVDSSVASTPLHLLVEEACRQRDKGLSAEELFVWAEEAKWHLHTFFMVDNLGALHRGGRIPKGVAVVGDALDMKPLLTFDLEGHLSIMGVAHGRKKGMRKLIQLYEKVHRSEVYGDTVAIGDADCPSEAYELANALQEAHPETRMLRSTIGPTIGAHVGPGMMSCCFWGADRRIRGNEDTRKAKGVRNQK